MTWRRQNEHITDTGGNSFNSVPGSRQCGSENTLQNILLANLPPCCGILSNYKHGRHLVYVGCSKSAALMKGCHNKPLWQNKGEKKRKKKRKAGPIEDKELLGEQVKQLTDREWRSWIEDAKVKEIQCGVICLAKWARREFLVSVFFFHATRGIIKQPIVFTVNLKNIMQSATDADIHGKVVPPHKTRNYPCHSPLPPHTTPDGETLHWAQQRNTSGPRHPTVMALWSFLRNVFSYPGLQIHADTNNIKPLEWTTPSSRRTDGSGAE